MSEWQKTGERLDSHAYEVSQEFGISQTITREAGHWALKWRDLLEEQGMHDECNPEQLYAARDAALQRYPAIPRDANQHATFRAELAAQELLYRAMPEQAPTYRRALEGDGLRVIPHFDRLDEIVTALLEARANNEFPYTLEAANLPQDERNMPPELPRGGRDHANYLWAGCYYMRGGIKSTAAFASLSNLYADEPGIFDPYNAQHDDPERITDLLKQYGLAFSAKMIGGAWVENARRMVEQYDGDPRRIFDDVNMYKQVLIRVKNRGNGRGFIGFQEKMASMITYYLMDAELIPYFDFPLPVDFHVLRVSAANEIITFEDTPSDGDIYHEKTLAMLRGMYHDYSATHGVSQLDVCNAVWSLSSAICGTQPGNIMLERDRNNRDGRNTFIEPLPIDTSSPTQIRMYERSCDLCPLEQTCSHNMPSKEYYIRGRAILSPRTRFESVDYNLFADDALRSMTKKTARDVVHVEPATVIDKSVERFDERTTPSAEDETLF